MMASVILGYPRATVKYIVASVLSVGKVRLSLTVFNALKLGVVQEKMNPKTIKPQ